MGLTQEASEWRTEIIPRNRWVTCENSSHMPHCEERKRYMEIVGEFLMEWNGV
jgi:pimeloyl-ACP methyl ester carboxylesterase